MLNELKLAMELVKSLKMVESFDIASALLKVLGLECFLYKLDSAKEFVRKVISQEQTTSLTNNIHLAQNNIIQYNTDLMGNTMDDIEEEPINFHNQKSIDFKQNTPLKNNKLESLKNASKEHMNELGFKNNDFGDLKNDFKRKMNDNNKENRFMKL